MRTLSPRLLLIGSAAFAGLAVVVPVLLSVLGDVPPVAAVQLAATLLVLAAAVAIVAGVRRTDGKALRIDTRTKRQDTALARTEGDLARLAATLDGLAGRLEEAARHQSGTVLAALGEDRMALTTQAGRLDELALSVARIDDAVQRNSAGLRELRDLVNDQTAGGVAQTVREIGERLDALGGDVRDGHAALSGAVRQNYAQLEALVDVRALLQPRAPLPRLRGWAASPDVLRLLVERVAVDHPKIIVECGSGASSVWLGYAVQRFGGGRVIALEHDERFAGSSRDLVIAHGLQDVVEIRHAPLTSWRDGDEVIPWYDTRALDDLTDIGLVFVDGPPGATAPLARYPALPALLPRCAPDAWFVLDDGARAAEREIADRWLAEFPEITGSSFPAEKGATVLRRTGR
ncbi:hypothetical protein Ssi03_46910 [Sphaerisporangium siamense]|uniref:Putative O-methyltransferase YrrM n=1 Tax=Sphaerisporangium siamense TaxID=795645 RepID=A0A7W7G7I4_9ACTN|nr:class I SAM-dependent methyltransferase [Sphaerisporangium siamense]MBB4699172.1 putative O-methyltransferase YrrM [Sphaerisporangium siamense]GII86701.1 hypothetical protein Ssi03_46910 [Sphaerisporangium siamense]